MSGSNSNRVQKGRKTVLNREELKSFHLKLHVFYTNKGKFLKTPKLKFLISLFCSFRPVELDAYKAEIFVGSLPFFLNTYIVLLVSCSGMTLNFTSLLLENGIRTNGLPRNTICVVLVQALNDTINGFNSLLSEPETFTTRKY